MWRPLQIVTNWGLGLACARFKGKFDEQARHAGAVNDALLLSILKENAATEYGRRYGFATITTPDEYRERVPLTAWPDYVPYVERIAEGATGVLTQEPIVHLSLSSGTTGTQKQIPVTARSQRAVAVNHAFITQGVLNQTLPGARRSGRGIFLVSAAQPAGQTPGGITRGTATSSGIKSMMKMAPLLWSSPPPVFFVGDGPSFMYLHLRFGLPERGLKHITAPFAATVLELLRTLETRWPELVLDIASGKITQNLNITPETRAALEKLVTPQPDLARQLKAEGGRGMNGIGPRVWPQLAYVSTVIGGSFKVYEDKLRAYLGDVPLYSAVYGASEAQIGICTQVGRAEYAMTPATAWFEFIPLSQIDQEQPATLRLAEVQPGDSYELAVTNTAGLYRYRLGDVVQVKGRYYNTPVIEFQYRRGQLLNVASEKTSEQAVIQAVLESMQKWGLTLVDFTTREDYEARPPRYEFSFEVKEAQPGQQLSSLSADLEAALIRASPYYQTYKNLNTIASPQVNFVAPGTFQELQRILIERGTSLSQVKVPRVIQDPELVALMQARRLSSPLY